MYENLTLRTADYDYDLPEKLIAQEPAPVRDQCRMLVMQRESGALEDRIFADIREYLRPGDLLIANETRVRPARLLGHKRGTGGAAEVFLLRERLQAVRSNTESQWEALVRPGKRLKPGAVVDFADEAGNVALSAEVIDWADQTGEGKGERLVRLFTTLPSLDEALHAVGNTPLPPYIKDYGGDKEMYQTVYSRNESSAAAPTAGLHFTPELITQLQEMGVRWETVELEVGLDTFRLIDEDDPTQHKIHTELFSVPQRTIDAIEQTKANGGRVFAVGTTSVRSLESAWDPELGALRARNREATSLYILPSFPFHVVDGMITNFHVPKSTLMMLVSAFSSHQNLMNAYRHAIQERYRFFSFGDAMFIH